MSTSTIYAVRQQLGYYGISTLLITGNIGNIFLILILGRALKQHSNSCSIYLLVASIANLFVLNTVLISTFYGLIHREPINLYNVLCKLRWYGGNTLFTISRSCMIGACIDRWALCSQNVKIRSICRPYIARRVIVLIVFISAVLSTQLLIYFNNNTGQCILSASYSLAYTIFALIAIVILPLSLMIIFSLLARHNLHLTRSRVASTSNQNQQFRIHKRDHDLMKMLAGEVLIYSITMVPYTVQFLYGYLTTPIAAEKSPMRLAIESLISFIIQPLMSFTYCCTQFYVCAMVSGRFRKEFMQLFRRQTVSQNRMETIMHTTTEQRQA